MGGNRLFSGMFGFGYIPVSWDARPKFQRCSYNRNKIMVKLSVAAASPNFTFWGYVG